MLLELKNRKFKKSPRVVYENMPNDEIKLISLLSSTYFYNYGEIKKFVYHNQAISDHEIMKKVNLLQDKYLLKIAINDYGARLRSKIYIKE